MLFGASFRQAFSRSLAQLSVLSATMGASAPIDWLDRVAVGRGVLDALGRGPGGGALEASWGLLRRGTCVCMHRGAASIACFGVLDVEVFRDEREGCQHVPCLARLKCLLMRCLTRV
jgi:hypothetical protein